MNGNAYDLAYYLADGTYPNWPVLIKTLRHAQDAMGKHFSKLQEAARKDVERAFGVLQSRWNILKMPCRLWDLTEVKQLMVACIILHNMIVEDRGTVDPFLQDFLSDSNTTIQENHRDPEIHHTLQSIQRNHHHLRQEVIHHRLTNDLKVYNWMRRGQA